MHHFEAGEMGPEKLVQSTVNGERNEKLVTGRHIYGNLYECDYETLTDEVRLVEIVREAARMANAMLISVGSYRFGANGGITVFGIIAESHISIHTWPEYKFATVDVYTCGDHTDPDAAFNFIVEALRPQRHEVFRGDRSLYI